MFVCPLLFARAESSEAHRCHRLVRVAHPLLTARTRTGLYHLILGGGLGLALLRCTPLLSRLLPLSFLPLPQPLVKILEEELGLALGRQILRE